jgi:hypothetical protein
MYYPNLIPSLIEALDNGIGEGKAFSMDDLKDARDDVVFGEIVWEACRYLWILHSVHESTDGGEVLPATKLRLDFIMRQSVYAKKRTVMQKSLDLEFECELAEANELLQPTAHYSWTQRANRFTVALDDGCIEAMNLNEDEAVILGEKMAGECGTWKLDGDTVVVTTKPVELDWGDDDDHDAAMTDWHSDLERDRKETVCQAQEDQS